APPATSTGAVLCHEGWPLRQQGWPFCFTETKTAQGTAAGSAPLGASLLITEHDGGGDTPGTQAGNVGASARRRDGLRLRVGQPCTHVGRPSHWGAWLSLTTVITLHEESGVGGARRCVALWRLDTCKPCWHPVKCGQRRVSTRSSGTPSLAWRHGPG